MGYVNTSPHAAPRPRRSLLDQLKGRIPSWRLRGIPYDPRPKKRFLSPQAIHYTQGDALTCTRCRKGYPALTTVCPHCGASYGSS